MSLPTSSISINSVPEKTLGWLQYYKYSPALSFLFPNEKSSLPLHTALDSAADLHPDAQFSYNLHIIVRACQDASNYSLFLPGLSFDWQKRCTLDGDASMDVVSVTRGEH